MKETTRLSQRDKALRWMRGHIGLVITLIAFLGVAGLYAVRTPFFEMPGEPWHLRRIQTLFGGQLPPGLASWNEVPEEPHADGQPPFYYVLGALLTRPLNIASDPAIYRPNPHAVAGDLQHGGDKNVMITIAPARADGPLAMAIWILRFFSVLCSAAALFFSYLVFLRLARGRTTTALASLVALAFMPGFLYLSGGVENRSLGFMLAALALYLSLRLVVEESPSTRVRWGALLAAGLAAMTVWWGWISIALVATANMIRIRDYMASRGGTESRIARSHVAILGGMGLVHMAWFFLQPIASDHSSMWQRLEYIGILQRTGMAFRAFWGLFGWLNIPADEIYYTTVALLLVLGAGGLVLRAIQAFWRNQGPPSDLLEALDIKTPRYLLAGLAFVLGLISFGLYVINPVRTFMGAALLPLTPLLSFLFVLGLEMWIRRTYTSVLLLMLILTFATVSFVAPFAYIAPAYAEPARLDLDHVPFDLRALDLAFGDEIFLLGYTLQNESVRPGGVLDMQLYWLARQQMTENYAMHLTIRGIESEMIASQFTQPGGGILPTSLWVPGDVIVHEIQVQIDQDATVPTAAEVRLSLFTLSDTEPLDATDPHGNTLQGDIGITQIRVAAPGSVRYLPESPIEANLDNEVSLFGYSLYPSQPQPGDTLRVVLYWRAEGPLIRDYTVFVHLADAEGALFSQIDGPPLEGHYPTYFWEMGEQVQDVHMLSLPHEMPDGDYYLHIGMYRLDTGERLTIVDSDPPQDHIVLGPIMVY